jgi:ABC-type molybdenum transport system ATPase subunit/photorepair protein PhrA
MATSTRLYAVNLDEIAQAIIAGGHYRTVLVQGHMGSGKSSLLNMLAAGLPKHVPCLLRLYHQRSGGYHDP